MKLTTAACLAVLAVTGCSKDVEPTESFKQDGNRVFESYGQSGKATKKVTLPKGTKSLLLKMDCINESGDIRVAVGPGLGDIPCSADASDGDSSIGLGAAAGTTFERNQTITVTAPAGATWSVAVDALDTPLPG